MGEEVTNTAVTETQTAAPAAEENVGTSQEPQVNQQETVEQPAENSTQEEVNGEQTQTTEDGEQQKQPTVEELKKTDPAKAYEFQRRFEGLSNEVMNKRNAVQQQNAYYEVNKFEQEYSPILHSSPALYNIMSQYVQNYGNTGNMYGQLKNVLDTIMPAYQEAFNAGRQYA